MLHSADSVACRVALATALPAQQADTLSPAQRAGAALALLGGQQVRIHRSGIGRVQGRLVSSSPTLVTLRTSDSSSIIVEQSLVKVHPTVIDIPASSVDSVWVKRGSHAGVGALIGVAGVGLCYLVSRSPSYGPTSGVAAQGPG